jgi:hypothetical protein
MSRTIPTSRPCAARCCNRIELAPSWRLATLLAAWLGAFGVMSLTAVALALPARIGICAAAIWGGARAIHATFLFAGRRPVAGLRWDETHLFVVLGRSRNEVCVTVAPGSFRWGRFGMLLRLRSCDGMRVIFIDSGGQDEAAMRALARWLKWPPRQAATIPPRI